MVEPRVNHFMGGGAKRDETDSLWPFRHVWHGTFISAGGHDFVSVRNHLLPLAGRRHLCYDHS